MKTFQPAIRVKLTEFESLRSIFSMDTILNEQDGVIQFVINNNRQDEKMFDEFRINFGYKMTRLPMHQEGVSWYWVRKKL